MAAKLKITLSLMRANRRVPKYIKNSFNTHVAIVQSIKR
jgi:hypothetical protein